MRLTTTLLVLLVLAGCNGAETVRKRIEILEKATYDAKYETAMACMEYILRHGNDFEYSKSLVGKLMDLGFYAEAMAAVEALLQKSPEDANLFHLRGLAYRKQCQYDLALADGLKASGLDPSNKTFSSALQATREERQIWNEIKQLNNALDHPGDSSDILLRRAEKFFSIQHYDAALYDLGAISKLGSPDDSIYFNGQSNAIYKTARPVEILEQTLDYFRKRYVKRSK